MPRYHPPCYPALVTSREGRLVVDTENAFKERGLDIHPTPSIKGEVQLRPRYTGGIRNIAGACLQKRKISQLGIKSLLLSRVSRLFQLPVHSDSHGPGLAHHCHRVRICVHKSLCSLMIALKQ